MFNRREAVSRIAMMVGGAFTAPTLFAMDVKESGKFLNADLFSLTDAQRQIVAAVAEHIIPKTNTAGAIDAGVPAFIELMFTSLAVKNEFLIFTPKELSTIALIILFVSNNTKLSMKSSLNCVKVLLS
jgi:hypothetical protein